MDERREDRGNVAHLVDHAGSDGDGDDEVVGLVIPRIEHNSKLPGIVITASEVNFLKAEAWERWGGDGPAMKRPSGSPISFTIT